MVDLGQEFKFHVVRVVWGIYKANFKVLLPAGVIRLRKLEKLPKRKCWFVSEARENAIDAATTFNENWETNLRIGRHDCRNYCEGI